MRFRNAQIGLVRHHTRAAGPKKEGKAHQRALKIGHCLIIAGAILQRHNVEPCGLRRDQVIELRLDGQPDLRRLCGKIRHQAQKHQRVAKTLFGMDKERPAGK